MKRLLPSIATTKVGPAGHYWEPAGFGEFLAELQRVKAEHADSVLLYRGHRDTVWLLDSLFARNFKSAVFGFNPGEIPNDRALASKSFALTIHSAFHFKFGIYSQPSQELRDLGASELEIDPWFEYLKRLQQHPEDDAPILKGSNLIDWSLSPDVACWFANCERIGSGANYIFDATAAGTIQITKPFGEVLEIMESHEWDKAPHGMPLLVCPTKQIAHQRTKNQQARYLAQMDLRLPMEQIWKMAEEKSPGQGKSFLKLILPAGTVDEAEKYTNGQGMTHDFLFI